MTDKKIVKDWEFYVAGIKFHGLHTVIYDMNAGDKLDLVPEPSNPHDPNAIKIKYNGVMLGYVPRKYSQEIAPWINPEANCTCTVIETDPGASTWNQLKVQVLVDTL